MPGDLDFSLSQNYQLYQFDAEVTPDATELSMSTVYNEDYFNMTTNRDYYAPYWYQQKSVVAFTENFTYPFNVPGTVVPTMKQVNMGAYSVWFQMSNKPQYWKAWQALNLANNLMLNSDMTNRVFAYNALEYFFNSFEDVQQYVLFGGLTTEQQNTIYNDELFGLGNVEGLRVWAAAAGKAAPSSTDEY